MIQNSENLKKGDYVSFSHGGGEDYIKSNAFLILKDFNYLEKAKEYLYEEMDKIFKKRKKISKEKISEEYYDFAWTNIFYCWLEDKGYISKINETNIYIGDFDYFGNMGESWIKEYKEMNANAD